MFKIVPVAATPSSVRTLVGDGISRHTKGIALQAPLTNAANLYFGDKNQQPAFIPPGASSDVMPVDSTGDLHILGTVGDDVIIMIF